MNYLESVNVTFEQWGDYMILSDRKIHQKPNYDCKYENIRKWITNLRMYPLLIGEDYMYKTEEVEAKTLLANDVVLHRGQLWGIKTVVLGSGTRLWFTLYIRNRTFEFAADQTYKISRIAHPVDVDKWLQDNV